MLRPDTDDVDLIFYVALSGITLSPTPGVSDGALVVDIMSFLFLVEFLDMTLSLVPCIELVAED